MGVFYRRYHATQLILNGPANTNAKVQYITTQDGIPK